MKNNKKIVIIIAAVLLVGIIGGGLLWGALSGKFGGLLAGNGGNPGSTQNTEADVTAENEENLRDLLAKDSEMVIEITEDLEVREGFVVNGTKTLVGTANLRMELGAELGQALLTVSENSSLTLDGPILDCNYNSDGIRIETNASLNCLSGAVKYAGAYGILAFGEVTIEDISIEDSEYIAICAQTNSKVTMKGGTVKGSSSNDIYVVPGAYVNISGNTVMEGALEHAMINYGTLELQGGKFGNVNNYLCDNYGELKVAYKGDDKDGAVEFYGARNSIFLVRKGSTASFSDVYIHDTNRQGIASLGGDTSIVNCKFENTGSHGIDIQSGKATVENVVITASKGSGLEASNGSEVKITNITVNGCEKIGIASRGASVTATNVNISNTGRYGLTCGTTKTGKGILIVEDAVIKTPTMHGVYVYDEGEAELKNIKISDGEARGMYVAATATCKVSGDSSIKNMTKGGVEVRGKLQLDDIVICDNNVANSGAGVYVADGGEVTMNGGAVYNNNSELRGAGLCVSDATLTINGTKIYDNTSVNHGGGLYAQKNAVVNLNSGEITKNYSKANGDGIYILSAETKVTVAEDFYLGGNDIKLDNVNAVLYISGDGLKKHSASEPLLLTPNYNAEEGTAVATCKNANVAKNLASVIGSGDGSYGVIQSDKQFVICYAAADMDMTGADTVYVTSFAELEEAVLSATSKRIIVLKADILMERRLRVPGGATIRITDDGTKRTLSRANGFTDSFFVTHYGTGLYVTGTKLGNLVLDGGYVTSADATKNQSLIRVAGSTEIRNVILQNNGTKLQENEVRGALVRQLCGDIKIYDSVLTGGNAYSGGALMLDKGTGYIQGCSFKDNESTIGGGAIRVAGGSELEVVSSVLLDNHAGSTGGGIVALENAVVTVKNTKFENNTAVSYGGALSAQDPGTIFKVNGTDNTTAIFKNNSSKTAGAVYMVKRAQLEISGYVFEGNSATDGRAGAVSVIDNSSATITNTTFYGNKASASGGAVVVDGSKAEIVCCEFGKENAGNVAGDKAGALLVTGGATVAVTAEDGAKYNSFNYNVANGVGGVVYVEKTSALNVANYSFTGNQGSSGGAIYIVDGAKVVSIRNQFKDNTAISGSTYGNGGAVYCAGTFTDNGSSYYENNAKNGGAVIVMGTGVATMDANLVTRGNTGNVAVMKDNAATVNGGAVFVNGGGMATISGYVLEGNVSDKAGSIQIQANAQAALKDLTFIGETGKEVYVKGNVDFNNLDGVVLVDAGASTSFVVSGYTQGNVIEFIPYKDEAKVVFKKAEGMTDEEFAEACGAITVTSASGESNWTVDENGALISFAVSITVGDTMKYFSSLKEAVEYANTTGGTGNADAMEIVLSGNASVYETLNVTKNITILGEAGTSITITRGTDFAGDMFVVAADSNAMLTLGTNNAEETGALIVDGASSSAIAGRIVDVQTGAGFTLAKNATLCNANSSIDGAAVQTASTNTVVYGVIKNNVTTTNCGGLNVLAGAKATINGATFSGNKGGTTAGALRIEAGAEVVCEDAQFTNNKGLKGNSTYVNGGAVYCAGTFTDTNSTYTGNVAKNGGVIIVVSGGVASLTGTDAQKAVLKDNQATVKGGAVFVNVGGTVTVDGYVLEGNVSEQAGSIQIQATASAELKNLTFNGENGTEIYVLGSLTFANLTGVRLVEGGSAASFVASGYEDGNVIEFTPYRYESKVVLQKADGMSDEDFATLCKAIIVTQTDDGRYWNINEEGLLVFAVASITDGDTTKYFNTLEAAVAYANNNGTTGDTAAIEVVLSEDTSISEVLNISKNITIVNASGKTVTVSRGAELTGDMFVVVADSNATLTLGTNASDESGAIVVDAASESIVAGRIVDVQTGTAFTLAKNATVQNANSSVDGAGIQTAATNTYVYGTIKDNVSTGNCGGLNVLENAKVTISGAMISGNQGGSAAGALRILAGAEVVCENTTFSNNKGLKGSSTYVNGGAVYCAGTFTDTNSSYIGNVAKNGGAIILQNGGTATLTGTDRTKAIFKDNQATGATNARGGAIFVNNGCSASVTGYIFEGNTSTGTTANTGEGAIHIISGGSASLTDVTFQGNATQNTYVAGSLTMSNLTGATLVGANANASIIVGGYQTGNAIEIKPYAYTEGNVILKRADQMSEDEFVNACNAFTIIQTDDGHYWNMDETGKLCMAVAGIAVGETMSYYNTIESAIAYANTNGGTGTEASIEIKVLENTQVRETLSITKNISLVNETGKEITLNRGTELTADMFVVVADSNATLVLGCNDTNETGKLIVSGASEAAIAARTITVNTGSGFVLAKNATLSNANSTINGGAIQTASADTVIYGIVSNNVTTLEGGGMEALAGADVSIEGAVFDSNSSSTSGTGGALIIRANAQVTCSNTMFTSNHVTSAKNGGAIYCAGTFTDTNSTYTGNEAKNGGAIFIPSGGVVNLTGTDSTKAIFKNNAAIYSSGKGGAIYVNGGTLTLTGYTFDGNTCGATVSSPTEKKNVSIWTASGTATLTDCTGLTE